MKKSIGKRDYYNDYIASICASIVKCEEDLLKYRKNRFAIIQLINANKFEDAYVFVKGNRYNIEYLAFTAQIMHLSKLVNKDSLMIVDSNGNDHENAMYLKANLYNIVKFNKLITTTLEEIKELESFKFDYDIYKAIIDIYDNEVIKFVLDGKVYRFGSGIGSMFIKEKDRNFNKKIVDFGASKKEKLRLLALGLIPYNKKDKEIAEANGETYNGVEWLIYRYDDFSYWLFWYKLKYIKNGIFYSLVPSKANHTGMTMKELEDSKCYNDIPKLKLGFIEMMHLCRRINPKQYLKYRKNKLQVKY